MAIMGFLVHTLPELCAQVETALSAMPEVTTYGVHQDCYVVAVAEAQSQEMEGLLAEVHALEGVITSYVTSLTLEDEQEDME